MMTHGFVREAGFAALLCAVALLPGAASAEQAAAQILAKGVAAGAAPGAIPLPIENEAACAARGGMMMSTTSGAKVCVGGGEVVSKPGVEAIAVESAPVAPPAKAAAAPAPAPKAAPAPAPAPVVEAAPAAPAPAPVAAAPAPAASEGLVTVRYQTDAEAAAACAAQGGISAYNFDGKFFCLTGSIYNPAFANPASIEAMVGMGGETVPVVSPSQVKSAGAWSESDEAACRAAGGQKAQSIDGRVVCVTR